MRPEQFQMIQFNFVASFCSFSEPVIEIVLIMLYDFQTETEIIIRDKRNTKLKTVRIKLSINYP